MFCEGIAGMIPGSVNEHFIKINKSTAKLAKYSMPINNPENIEKV